ncbi:MAG: CvpA family protein [Tepidiformaceae bacterium]
MSWLDGLLLVVIGGITYRAYLSGFVRELVSLCALILAVPLAGVFYDDMYPKVHPIVDNEFLANLISFLAILLGVVVAGQVAAHLLKRGVAMLNLGGADRVAGAAFGFFKAVVLCQVVLIAFVVFPKPDLLGTIDDSPVAAALLDSAPAVLAILPGTFDQGLDVFTAGVGRSGDAEAAPAPTPE